MHKTKHFLRPSKQESGHGKNESLYRNTVKLQVTKNFFQYSVIFRSGDANFKMVFLVKRYRRKSVLNLAKAV